MATRTLAKPGFKYYNTIGRTNLSGIGFRNPVDLALAPGGLIYVLSRAGETQLHGTRVSRLNVAEEFLGEFGSRGAEDGEFIWPFALAVDHQGRVYVADEWLQRISVFSSEGQFLHKWGVPGSREGEMNGPSGLAFDADDNLYVVDSNNNRIQKFTKEGKVLSCWGRAGGGDGEFNLPWGITLDRAGSVYVADWRNDRIQKFSPEGKFVLKVGKSGSGEGQLNRPTGVAVDKDGVIYVTDWGNDRVQVFDPQGRFITLWTGDAGVSTWAQLQINASPDVIEERKTVKGLKEMERRFWEPIAVEVDDENKVFIVDCRRDRLQVYQKG